LTKATKGKPRIRLDGFIDIDCAGWDQMVVGVLYEPSGTTVVRDPDSLIDELMGGGGHWWTWNGGRYDSLQIAERMRARGLRATASLSGSSVTRIACGNLLVLDACGLIPLPLGRKRGRADPCGADLAGVEPPGPLGWPCRCGDDCGGYCQIHTGLSERRTAELADYCAYDARVGYLAVQAVIREAERAQLELRGTLGGTAWATAQAWAGLPDAEWRSSTWREVRRAYFGGRTIVARPTAPSGWHYDLSSAYPAALATTPVPIGDAVEVGGKRARIAYARQLPGVYVAEVDVPEDQWIPPLPVRLPDESIAYPIGRVRGTWTLLELAEAERRGAKVRRVTEGVVWPDGAAPIYADVVTRWYAERMRRGKASAWGAWWRLLANSLTGKLAEHPERHSVSINPAKVKICVPGKSRANRAGCTVRYCTGRCGSYRQLDSEGRVYSVPFYRIGKAAQVHHAAYLTAATRARLMEGIDQVGTDLVYSDTDSIWTLDRAPSPVGAGLGEWERKHLWGDFSARAPKVYRYVTTDGEVVCRVAGMGHLTDQDWALMAAGGRVSTDRGVMTLLESAPSDRLFRRRYREGRLPPVTGWYGDRVLRTHGGLTYPVSYGEVEKRQKEQARARGREAG